MIKFLLISAIFFVTVTANIFTKEEIATLQKIQEDCKKESGVDEGVLKSAIKGEYADDPKLKEHLLCCTKKLGFQNDKGEVVPEVITTTFAEHFKNVKVIETLVQQCTETKDSQQNTALYLVKCLHQLVPSDSDITELLLN